jgi:hypothetical protein
MERIMGAQMSSGSGGIFIQDQVEENQIFPKLSKKFKSKHKNYV